MPKLQGPLPVPAHCRQCGPTDSLSPDHAHDDYTNHPGGMGEYRSMWEVPVIRQLIDRWRHFWALSWLWKGLALGSAAATLIALAVGVVVLASGGDGDSPAVLGPRAASPTATTTPPSTPSPTPTATVSPHPPATSEKTPTSPAPYAPAAAAPAPKPAPKPAPAPTPTPAPSGSDAVLVGAGDIASGDSGDEATAKLLDGIAGTVFTAGDNAYESGTDAQFANYYNPTWGRH